MQVPLLSLWNTAMVLALKGQFVPQIKTQFLLLVFSVNFPVIFIFVSF